MKTIPTWAERLLRKELHATINGCAFDEQAAHKLLSLIAPRRKNEKQKATAKRKLQGAAARRAGTAELRTAVFARTGLGCELGQHPLASDGAEMHHLQAGSAKRATESVENCLRACMACHRIWHREGPSQFIPFVKQWAERHGYPLPSIIRKAEASAQLPGRAAR